jgi:hypothetical protein
MLRPLLVFWLITYSLWYRIRPWNFFQLNSDYFNGEKNIFSKLDLDQYIPRRWRLCQLVDDETIVPEFPVFVKPEWGQNSHGVVLVNNLVELNTARSKRSVKNVMFLLQEAATETREFEIFYVRLPEDSERAAVLSVTETINRSGALLPVNGINNMDSIYFDKTDKFSESDLQTLWSLIKSIGFFRIGRVGLRADSIRELLEGKFHVIEVNIFLPMPLVLLDENISWAKKHRFIRKSMKEAARMASTCGQPKKRYPIFFRQLIAHYKVKE